MANPIRRMTKRLPPSRALLGVALGALAIGAAAVGALAIGQMAIGRLAIGRARIGRLQIDDLVVGRVSLRPDEAVLGHCKVPSSAGPAGGGCAIVVGGIKNARAISSVRRPHTVWSVSATWPSRAIAGWQHVKMRRSKSSSSPGSKWFSVSSIVVACGDTSPIAASFSAAPTR